VFHNTLSAQPLFVGYTERVAIKLDVNDLVVILANNYFSEVDYINIVSGIDLLLLPATNLHCMDTIVIKQAGLQPCLMPYAVCIILVTAGKWS
jgi:hypothetical protein